MTFFLAAELGFRCWSNNYKIQKIIQIIRGLFKQNHYREIFSPWSDVVFITHIKKRFDVGVSTPRSRYRGSFYQVCWKLLLMTEIPVLCVNMVNTEIITPSSVHAPTDEQLHCLVWWPCLAERSRFNRICTSPFGLLAVLVFLSFHELFPGREKQESHTEATR